MRYKLRTQSNYCKNIMNNIHTFKHISHGHVNFNGWYFNLYIFAINYLSFLILYVNVN